MMMVRICSHTIFHSVLIMSLVLAVPAWSGHLCNNARSNILRRRGLTVSTTTTTRMTTCLFSSSSEEKANITDMSSPSSPPPSPPLYVQEGLFAVHKPLDWTSQQVVGKLRWILEQNAKERQVIDVRTKKRKPWIKIGHGGTLDPLATGVLVIGVGSGTKSLQKYLTGSKGYRATIELGYQTTTLDLDPNGEIVSRKSFDHVTQEMIEQILPQFRGTIQQTPPIFSALKKDGKRLYELGRQGKTAEDVVIEAREVQIYRLDLLLPSSEEGNHNEKENEEEGGGDETTATSISKFEIDVECGGGTYIRSLVRDIGLALDTVATMTSLVRTKQGVFLPEHCLEEKEWSTVENIWKSIESSRDILATIDNHETNNDE